MKIKTSLTIGCALLFATTFYLKVPQALAADTGFETDGQVTVRASDQTKPLDPENPSTTVDPGGSPSTDGPLRIDFVSEINFAGAKITETNRQYNSLAQLFHGETTPRASYIQVTDLREGTPGWSLQLKQETQFKNKDSVELNGAILSFDKGWASSNGTGKAPSVFRDTIAIDTMGSAYSVASAGQGSGNGTWMISFGASATNQMGHANTLSPLNDELGKPIVDPFFKKDVFLNSAVSLTVPDKTDILPGDYTTELTWLLQATP